jgi:hypothetical protein
MRDMVDSLYIPEHKNKITRQMPPPLARPVSPNLPANLIEEKK